MAMEHPADEISIEFVTVSQGYRSAVEEAYEKVITCQGTWEEFWNSHCPHKLPMPSAAKVDFQFDMVLCVSMGTCNCGGYSFEVKRVENATDVVVVHCEKRTKPRGFVISGLTQPYHMVRIRQTSKPVRFVVHDRPPTPPPPAFIITCADEDKAEQVINKVNELDFVESTEYLSIIGGGIVNVYPTETKMALKMLYEVEGVESVTRDQ